MIIDSHCHLHDAAFDDLRGALACAAEHDVWGIVAVGCEQQSNARTLEAATANGRTVWPAVGFHPDWVQLTDLDLERVEAQVAAHHARLVALGEIGLPWYCLEGATDAAGLKTHGIERAVFHWHKAPAEVTRAIVDAGYLVSVTPEVVYRERDRELVEAVPVESPPVESDGPWPYQGEVAGMPSGPWLVSRVAEEVAKIKGLPVDEVTYQISANTCQLFNLA